MYACPHSLCFCLDLLEIVDVTSFIKMGLLSLPGEKSSQKTDICQIKFGSYNTSKDNMNVRTKLTPAAAHKTKRKQNIQTCPIM